MTSVLGFGRRRVAAIVTCASALCVLPSLGGRALRAQPTPVSRVVLGELYREAQRASPRLEAVRALAQAIGSRVTAAKLPPDPQVQLGFMNYALPGLVPMDPLGMTQLQLMQMIPTAGKLRLSGQVASARAAAAFARTSDAEWEVRTQVAMVFYDLYATDRSLEVAGQTLRLLQDVLRTAEAMYRVGEGRQADVLRAQVEIARMTEDTLRMRAMRSTMAARLNALLDRDLKDAVGSPTLPAFLEAVPAIDSLEAVATRSRPMLRGGEHDLRAADAEVQLARREIWPDLQIGIQYGQRSGEMGSERMGSLMIGASLPIFARDRQLRMREEAVAMRRMADAELTAMRAETRGRVGEAYANLTRARRLGALYRSTVIPQAEATVSSALAAYRVGGVDFMTLLDARMMVNQLRQQLFTLEGDEGKAWAELEMLTGKQLIDPFAAQREVAVGGDR